LDLDGLDLVTPERADLDFADLDFADLDSASTDLTDLDSTSLDFTSPVPDGCFGRERLVFRFIQCT
jgi:uncharacterized protein YjbI with pentapeptide repeats